jgi:hypothetical protein
MEYFLRISKNSRLLLIKCICVLTSSREGERSTVLLPQKWCKTIKGEKPSPFSHDEASDLESDLEQFSPKME